MGHWIAASKALGRLVPFNDPYPHICDRTIAAEQTMSGLPLQVTRWEKARYCAACAAARAPALTIASTAQPAPQEDPMSDPALMLLSAYALAAEGLPVFFLGRTKRPVANCPNCPKDTPEHNPEACPCLTCHGFYAATTDPDRITAMRAAVPRGLLAIRTGTVAGIAVVDIDPRNGGRVVPELMPPTRAVRTGSDGWHLYYAHPGSTLAAKLHGHPGIDIKADGGYVVAPPSIHPGTGRPYRWVGDRPVIEMPPPLVDACRPIEPVAPAVPHATVTTLSGGRGISSPDALLTANLDAVRNAPPGQRRTRLYGAARGVARMIAAGAITEADAVAALTAVGREMGQPARDIRAAITGGFRAESVATEGIAA